MSTMDGIGSQTASQWSPALSSLSSALSTYLQDKMLKKVDVDSSGSVEQNEFRAAMEQLTTKLGVAMGEEESNGLFTSLDTSADGTLDGDELGQLIRHVFAAPTNTQDFLAGRGGDAGQALDFDAIDADGDGTLTRAEFDRVASSSASGSSDAQVEESAAVGTANAKSLAEAQTALASPAGNAVTASDPMKALLAKADADGNGQVSSGEVDRFIAQLASQMQLALTQLKDTSATQRQA